MYSCNFYWEEGYIRGRYEKFMSLIRAQDIHLNADQRVCMGSYRPGAEEVIRGHGASLYQAVIEELRKRADRLVRSQEEKAPVRSI